MNSTELLELYKANYDIFDDYMKLLDTPVYRYISPKGIIMSGDEYKDLCAAKPYVYQSDVDKSLYYAEDRAKLLNLYVERLPHSFNIFSYYPTLMGDYNIHSDLFFRPFEPSQYIIIDYYLEVLRDVVEGGKAIYALYDDGSKVVVGTDMIDHRIKYLEDKLL